MATQRLTAFERNILASLAEQAGLAAILLEVWADLSSDSVQTARSLVDVAQLNTTEEGATQSFLERSASLGLVEAESTGFRPGVGMHERFPRLAFALYAVEHHRSSVHRDATVAQVVLTKPPRPSLLEQKLSELGWRTAELEVTEHAFHGMVRAARQRVVVMTPFFDSTGATWLQELLSHTLPDVECTLILRSLEDRRRKDYPIGFATISAWLKMRGVRVFNYSIPHVNGGRETFHAKVVLCDRNSAYLGSSNITAASLEHSMEMGVVLNGRAVATISEVLDSVLSASTQWL